MNKEFFYVASTNMDLSKKISKTNIYKDKNRCILNIAKELMNQYNIEPTTGILTDKLTDEKIYTIIERYTDQFSELNLFINLCKIVFKDNIKEDEITFEDISQIEIIKINNLYEYLKKQKSFELIINESKDKWWFDIPSDDGDIIQKSFLELKKSNDKFENEKQILLLQKLFPKQTNTIKKLSKLMIKMNEKDFCAFIIEIYNEKEQSLNYEFINGIEKNYTVKEKIKKITKKLKKAN